MGKHRWMRAVATALLGATSGVLVEATVDVTPAAAVDPYEALVLGDQPLSYWRLGETSGTTADDAVGSSNGTYGSGVQLDRLGVAPGNRAAGFTGGSSSYVSIGSPGSIAPTSLSIEAWFRCDGTNCGSVSDDGPAILRWRTYGYGIFLDEVTLAPRAYVASNNAADTQGIVSPVPANDGRWHHVVVTRASGTLSLYVDGARIGSVAVAGSIRYGSGGAAIGRDGNHGSDYFRGDIDEVAVYGRALTPTEVLQHFRSASPSISGGPLRPAEVRGGGSRSLNVGVCTAGDPVSLPSGEFWRTFSDFDIPGRGPGLRLDHTYSSSDAAADGPLGHGWAHSLDMGLSVAGSTATVREEGGSELVFHQAGTQWQAAPRVAATLVHGLDGTWTFTRRHQQVFTFDAAGRLTAVRDLLGNGVVLAYDGSGQLTTVTDDAGRALTFTWSGGRIASVTDGADPPRSVAFSYDAAGDLVGYTDVAGGTWAFTYDAAHRLLTTRSPRHAADPTPPVVTNHYDAQGRVDVQTDELGGTTTFDYTSISNAVKVTDPAGNTFVRGFTEGFCTSLTRGWGTPDEATWTYTNDPYTGQRTSVTDPNGTTTTTTYDEAGNPVAVTDGAGRTTAATFNAMGQPLTMTDPEGVTTTFTYDAFGQRTSVSTPLLDELGATVATRTATYHRDDPTEPGDVTSVTDPRGEDWSYGYDAAGNLVEATDPLGRVSTASFDAVGRPLSVTTPRGNAPGATPADFTTTFTELDPRGMVLSSVDPEGGAVARTYDANGNLSSLTDADGNVTSYVYDDLDRLVEVHRPDLSTTATAYWPDGAVRLQVDGSGAETEYTYDALGHVASVTDPLGRTTIADHDAVGNVLTRQDPGGDCGATPATGCTTYDYDAANQLLSIDHADPATADVVDIDYDDNGRRVSMVDGSGTSSWTWDSLGRLVEHEDGAGSVVGYDYDLADLVVGIDYPGALGSVTRDHDDAGQLVAVTDWLGNTTSFDYDADGNQTVTEFPIGTGRQDVTAYDRVGRVTAVDHTGPGASSATLDYGRTSGGWVDSMAQTGLPGPAAEAYGYDPLDRLVAIGTDDLGYDDADNLAQLADGSLQIFDPANQLCFRSPATTGTCAAPPSDATTFEYGPTGNRTAERPPGGVPTTYGYDDADRLTTATVPAVAGGDGQYHAVTPTPVVNTSSGLGTCTPSPCAMPAAFSTTLVQVAGLAGVPTSGVSAVALTIHVSEPPAAGWLTAFPGPGPVPNAASLLFNPGQTTSNNVVTALGATGQVALFTSVSAHVVVEVTGWYSTANGGPGLTLHPTSPARLMATDTGVGPCTPSPCARLGSGTVTEIAVAGNAGVPATGASAVVVVAHAYTPTAPGWLTFWATGTPPPMALSMTYDAVIASETMIVPVGANGRISVYSSSSTHLALDVVGWYGPASSGDGFVARAVTPAIFTDTQTGLGACTPSPCARLAAGSTEIEVAGRGNIPSDATTVALVLHAISPTATAVLTVGPAGSPPSATGSLTVLAGQLASNMVVTPLGPNGRITVTTTSPVDVSVQSMAWFAASTETWTYAYDGDGLRTAKTDPDGGTIAFSWDRSRGLPLLLAETTASGTTAYLYGPGGLPIASIDPAGAARYHHHDQLGSTRMLSNETGTPIGYASYDAYGRPVAAVGATTALGFAGQYTDAETGFQYLRARYYDPRSGQFLTRDPIEASTRSPYAYVSGNPLNATDPSGLCGPFGDGGCPGGSLVPDEISDPIGDLAERGRDVAVAVRNAPVTAVTAGVNQLTGGNCDLEAHLTFVCYGGAISELSGSTFTTGNTINTTEPDGSLRGTDLFEHEFVHSIQWAILGPVRFPVAYGANYLVSDMISGTQCYNIFEWWAGFSSGGYTQCTC